MSESQKSYDVAVIGGGPGGYTAAIRAAQLGLSTVCVERDKLGGICLNWGCIPSKALLSTAALYQEMVDAKKWGLSASEVGVDWPKVIKRSRQVAGRLEKGVGSLFKKYGVTHIGGTARIERPGRIEVGGETIEARHIIVATGARPRPLPGADFDGERILSSREAMVLAEQPKRILIVGAGAIGCEFAYFFNALGTEVTLVEMADRIVPVEDAEISDGLEKSFRRQGIVVRTQSVVEEVQVTERGITARVRPRDGEVEPSTVEADHVLVAIGVQGNTEELGLAEAGVELSRGWIQVDPDLRTSTPGIYAIGDVAGPPWLAHKASWEGIHCVERIAGHRGKPVAYDNIPGCTYCEPQVASVGLTEAAARELGRELKIGRLPFIAHGKSLASGHTEGFTKVILDAETGELLGCHMLGHGVTDLIAEPTLARSLEATEAEILATSHPHPTLSEVIHEAVGQAFGEGVNL
ncbi:MAG: dihydrolipoyl dehydrogenase [Deltaproteobacteria bacterium]|nr:dihydrolipoyl dehydrogenase [Deltaproteobacteria bacterium]MCB9788674.1 dihydrolipoyl dehydrogenase [Deltaproteobacteria bacterium]